MNETYKQHLHEGDYGWYSGFLMRRMMTPYTVWQLFDVSIRLETMGRLWRKA
jgi:hypothetical protein